MHKNVNNFRFCKRHYPSDFMFVCFNGCIFKRGKESTRLEIYVSVIRKRSKVLLMKNATRCHVETLCREHHSCRSPLIHSAQQPLKPDGLPWSLFVL